MVAMVIQVLTLYTSVAVVADVYAVSVDCLVALFGQAGQLSVCVVPEDSVVARLLCDLVGIVDVVPSICIINADCFV